MKLTTEDMEIIRQTLLMVSEKLQLSCGNFYVSQSNLAKAMNEVIVSTIGKDLGLIIPKYYVACIDKKYYKISEDLNNLGEFTPMTYFEYPRKIETSLIELWDYIENDREISNRFELMVDLVKTYIFDHFLINWDRNLGNYGVLTAEDNIRLALIDHEFAFSFEFMETLSSYIVDERGELDDNFAKVKEEDLTYFLEHYNPLLTQILVDYYNFLTPTYFMSVLERVEKDNKMLGNSKNDQIIIPGKAKLIKLYEQNYDIIKKTMEDYYGTRKKLLKYNRNK